MEAIHEEIALLDAPDVNDFDDSASDHPPSRSSRSLLYSNDSRQSQRRRRRRLQGVVFGRSVESNGDNIVLHVACIQSLQQPPQPHHQKRSARSTQYGNLLLPSHFVLDDDEDHGNADYVVLHLQFGDARIDSHHDGGQPNRSLASAALRSYCQRLCRLGDLIDLEDDNTNDDDDDDETKRRFLFGSMNMDLSLSVGASQMVITLNSIAHAARVLRVSRKYYWTLQQCQTWQQQVFGDCYNNDSGAGNSHLMAGSLMSMQRYGAGGGAGVKPRLELYPSAGCRCSRDKHDFAVPKEKQVQYLTHFLIRMMMYKIQQSQNPFKSQQHNNVSCLNTDASQWALPDPAKNLHNQQDQDDEYFCLYTRAIAALNQGTGVLDVAGGLGHWSMALSLAGIRSTLIDVRKDVGQLSDHDRRLAWKEHQLQLQRKTSPLSSSSCPTLAARENQFPASYFCQPVVPFSSLQASFGSRLSLDDGVKLSSEQQDTDNGTSVRHTLPLIDSETHSIVSSCSALVGLHPDEATDAIVDMAVAKRIPFCIVPCCVLAHLFPHRRRSRTKTMITSPPSTTHDNHSASVSTYEELLDYLQAKHPTIQRTTLPQLGIKNTVLWSVF